MDLETFKFVVNDLTIAYVGRLLELEEETGCRVGKSLWETLVKDGRIIKVSIFNNEGANVLQDSKENQMTTTTTTVTTPRARVINGKKKVAKKALSAKKVAKKASKKVANKRIVAKKK